MRGSIRVKLNGRDAVFTGPKLRVVYSGCNYNSVVFTMDNSQIEFENWLQDVWEWFQATIRADPVRFKCNRREPGFSDFIVIPSRDPETYPNELRCRLASKRLNDNTVCNALLECNGQLVDPSAVWSGSFMTPVFRLGYFKDQQDNYGLNLTVLKAEYEPSMSTQIQNDAWIIDSNTSGSPGESVAETMSKEDCMIVL